MEVYQFIKQIGQSRYGDVWLVKGSKTRRNYVLKRIDLHHISKREQRAAHSEAKLLSTIKHPNIVTYLDSFYNSKGSLFIVMNYCEHGNLHDFIKNRNGEYFEEEEIINLFVQICMALKYLHDQSILHRDVKTQNIFLTKQGLVKVGDFGIARIFKAVEKMSTIFVTSPCYTSPEVFFGEPFSPKSDVWSAGCCFYEIAALKYAFSAQDISISMWPTIQTRVSQIPMIYSSDLIQVTLSMLNLESDKRPTITELLLNDYIRKHILHFIRDTSNRSQSSQSGSCKVRCVANSEINSEAYSSVYSNETKCANVKGKIREGMFKTIPDINGNGDGNDNSQQQAFSCDKNSPNNIKSPTCFTTSKNVLNSFDKPLKNNSSHHTIGENPNSERKNFILNESQVTNGKRRQFFAQKLKSESSFKLLNTLTNSMNVTRFKSLDSFCDGNILFPSLPKSNCKYGVNPPKSAEDLLLLSQKTNVVFSKRPATSGEINFGALSDFQTDSKLPLINENANGTTSILKKSCVANLPPLYKSEFSLCENTNEEKNERLPNLEDSIIDKFLVSNIMECNKIIQSNVVNNEVITNEQNCRFSEVLCPPESGKEVLYQANSGSNS